MGAVKKTKTSGVMAGPIICGRCEIPVVLLGARTRHLAKDPRQTERVVCPRCGSSSRGTDEQVAVIQGAR